ncbi:MAG TPA: dephospho-CoA kinase, partial [bacterium]|nr:dephospho-CoA kinase [bacterium]
MKNDRTIVVAITGGIGSGKSSVLSMMADLGARVIDADKLAREALSKGAPAYLKMVERYGPSILDQNKEIDRSALASIAFDSDDDRTFIEKAIHPFVKNEINRLASEFSKTGTRVVAAEIPLLFEVGWEKEFGA